MEDWLGWVSREIWAVGVGEEPGWSRAGCRAASRPLSPHGPASHFVLDALHTGSKGGRGGVQGRRGKARRTLCLGKARGWLGRTLVRDDSAGKGKQADEEEPPHRGGTVVNRGGRCEMLQAVQRRALDRRGGGWKGIWRSRNTQTDATHMWLPCELLGRVAVRKTLVVGVPW